MEAKEKDMPNWEAERLVLIHGKEKALEFAHERRCNTESDSTAMYYDSVYKAIFKTQKP